MHSVLFSLLYAVTAAAGGPDLPTGTLVSDDCKTCHAQEYAAWQSSHHAQAMSTAETTQPLGNFENQTASHFGLRGEFHRVDGKSVMTIKEGTQLSHHIVTDSFGIEPLQQYLTEVEPGQKQVLPFAWDTRDKQDGGQRWISIQPDEQITPADRLHWRQPLANWNGMCADCHATGLQRHYDVEQAKFATTYDEPRVGCGSCHGSQPHTTNPTPRHSSSGFTPRYPSERTPSIHTPSGTQQTSATQTMDVCAGCHSLRSPLRDGFTPEEPFLDQFTPSLIEPALYFPDGQINEEVYVWGSFLQSRMHAEGVTCGNCHDPHSQALKFTGNALCGQCHLDDTYNQPQHHHHATTSAGAQCVNCHMPSRTYMAVDDRRDHSFHIPNPARSKTLGSPDPCTNCHADKSADWASPLVAQWRQSNKNAAAGTAQANTSDPIGKTTDTDTDTDTNTTNGLTLWQAQQSGDRLRPAELKTVLSDTSLGELRRATALQLYARSNPSIDPNVLQAYLQGDAPLLTLAAINASAALPASNKQSLLSPLLSHPRRALRVAAANQLRPFLHSTAPSATSSPQHALQTPQPTPNAVTALSEADTADRVNSWRGEGLLNKALRLEQNGQLKQAAAAYLQAINIDPYFEASYVNLTDLYRRLGDPRREQLLYSKALQTLPKSSVLRYSYALHLIRRKNTKAALTQIEEALELTPADAQSAYLYLLLLDNAGRTLEANRWLIDHLASFRRAPQVLQIGLKHARALGDENAATQIYRTLLEMQRDGADK